MLLARVHLPRKGETSRQGGPTPFDGAGPYYGFLSNYVYKSSWTERERKVKFTFHGAWIDHEFSDDRRMVVIHNHRCITVQRGTSIGTKDVLSDISIVLGLQSIDGQFRRFVGEFEAIHRKYPNMDHWVTGHSLGGSIALKIYERYKTELKGCHVFNPGTAKLELTGVADPRLTIWVVVGDPISALISGNPNTRLIEKTRANKSPHSSEQFVLGRLDK